MDYRKIGNLDVSVFTLGTVQLGIDYGMVGSTKKPTQDAAFAVLDKAAELGVNTWDTANNYGDSERVIGNWVTEKRGPTPNIITKIGPLTHASPAALRDDILRQTEKCCKDLQQDSLDMLMLHSFEDYAYDPDVCTKAFQEFKDQGIIRTSAISAYSNHDYRVMADSVFDAVQIPLNVFDWQKVENGELEALHKAGKAIFTRSVFLQGLVFLDPEKLPEKMMFCKPALEKYQLLCKEFEVSPAVLALSYVLGLPGVTSVVLGCQTPEQVESNCQMLSNSITLTADQMASLRDAFVNVDPRMLDPRQWNK